jgi:predicted DNA-binding transcriptional regulator YafY
MDENAIALKVLLAQAKVEPENAPALWKAARILLNTSSETKAALNQQKKVQEKQEKKQAFKADNLPDSAVSSLKAEFDYLDENGLYTHRTIYVQDVTDGRDVKRNQNVPVADRYGYLLTGYCTLRKQIRSFRSSRISNLRTFVHGEARQANRQWKSAVARIAS